jgi:hypothetical protein
MHLSPAALPGLLRASGGQLVDGAVLLAWIVLSAGGLPAPHLGHHLPRRAETAARRIRQTHRRRADRRRIGLLAEALGAATSAAALSEHHVPRIWSQPGVLGTAAAVPLLAAMYGLLGVGLGLLLRHTAAALGPALMWAFVIEGIIPMLTHEAGMVRWLPEAAASAVLHGASPAATHAVRGRGARRPRRHHTHQSPRIS